MPTVTADKQMVFEQDCAPRRVLELFTVKWTSMVLHALQHLPGRTARTSALQRSLPGISKKMLVQTLRDMEQRGLVARRVYDVVPPKVEYTLTPLGVRFAEPIEMLYLWGEQNKEALDQLQAAASGGPCAAVPTANQTH
ncbi:winged helix-turn-helix transcriptional regulator [Geminicoccus flavidas]|uniref:winged helix-turn-helix transcriptional regulator n=1 Tax=Geminicoccus flavidas TaxID=2506407 RepID=UPI00135A75C3|nr:helix-turn-helix domain-containing protein [Geminicoccus flavidas]